MYNGDHDYEAARERNIAQNKALLLSLDVAKYTIPAPAAKPVKPKVATPKHKKRAHDTNDHEENSDQISVKRAKIERRVGDDAPLGERRSSRNVPRVSYASDGYIAAKSVIAKLPAKSGTKRVYEGDLEMGLVDETKQRQVAKMGMRTHDPKTFGAIPGVEVGTWFATRALASQAAIHAPWVAGIEGDKDKGAYSIALSGGYADDVDMGEAFTFTGAGGRDLKGTAAQPKNLRTAPQSCDQTFEKRLNKCLQMSVETRLPVRVLRGYKLPSQYAPSEGYRYDGLYTVEKAWMDQGLEGFKVCKYALKRIPGQPAIPVVNADESDTGSDSEEVDDNRNDTEDSEADAE